MRIFSFFILLIFCYIVPSAQIQKKAADFGIRIGVMSPGKLNAITDVRGVKVGQTTLIKADSIRPASPLFFHMKEICFSKKYRLQFMWATVLASLQASRS